MKKVIAILLSVVLLFFSLGVTVATHYCFDTPTDTKLFATLGEIGCGMMQASVDCEALPEETDGLSRQSCCSSDFTQLEIENEFEVSQELIPTQLQFAVAFVASFQLRYQIQTVRNELRIPPPPDLSGLNRQVKFQSFLI